MCQAAAANAVYGMVTAGGIPKAMPGYESLLPFPAKLPFILQQDSTVTMTLRAALRAGWRFAATALRERA